MNVLFFVEHLGTGGVVRQVSTLSDLLARRGHRVSLLGLYPIDDTWRSLWDSRARALGTLLPRPPVNARTAALPLLEAARELRRLLRREQVDTLYCYEGHLARLLGWLVTRRASEATLVWGGQGADSKIASPDWRIRLPARLCRRVSGSVPMLISNSEAGQRNRMAHGYRCPEQLVIRNRLDTNRFRSDADGRARVRAEWGVPPDERLVGLVGRLDPAKGQRSFLEAAALVARRRTDVRFLLVGDGSAAFRAELERFARESGLESRLVWGGARTDMPAVYSGLDVLCSASLTEGFPNVVAEAMACGVPCVVTDVGDSALIVDGAGIVVRPGAPAELADGLNAMLLRLEDVRPDALRGRITSRFGLAGWAEATEDALTLARSIS